MPYSAHSVSNYNIRSRSSNWLRNFLFCCPFFRAETIFALTSGLHLWWNQSNWATKFNKIKIPKLFYKKHQGFFNFIESFTTDLWSFFWGSEPILRLLLVAFSFRWPTSSSNNLCYRFVDVILATSKTITTQYGNQSVDTILNDIKM